MEPLTDAKPDEAEVLMQDSVASSLLQSFLSTSLWFSNSENTSSATDQEARGNEEEVCN